MEKANYQFLANELAEEDSGRGELTLVDLFSGAGGISEGFRQAGYRVLAGTDADPDACATFSLNFPNAECIHGDIRNRQIREQLLAASDLADVIVGGPPCQAFSQVRNHVRIIDDPRNSLYRQFVQVVDQVTPRAFVMENVTGIDQMGVREQIQKDLSLSGKYKVAAQVLDAADFGVPQTRKRLLFIGIHESLRAHPPHLTGSGATSCIALARRPSSRKSRYEVAVQREPFAASLAEQLYDDNDVTVVTAAQAISDLENLPTGNRNDLLDYGSLSAPKSKYQELMRVGAGPAIANVQVPRINADTALRLRGIPAGGNHRDLSDDLLERYITGQRWGQDNGTGRLSRRHFYAYRRLHPSVWGWTLNTKGDSVYHYKKARSLSVREFARLQSFPDRFIVVTDQRRGPLKGRHAGGPAHSRYRQIGNAVPPLLARAVADALRAIVQSAVIETEAKAAA